MGDHAPRLRDEQNTPAERAIWRHTTEAIGHVLGVKDQLKMSPEDERRLRGVVLREFNELADLAVSLLRASDVDLGEEVVRMLSEIHSAVVPQPLQR